MKIKDIQSQDIRSNKDFKYNMFRYIISSTPRSGTKFMSRFFCSAGIPIGHEMYFGMPGFGSYLSHAVGDSSWMTVPFLPQFDKTKTTIIHIVRNPLKTVSSLLSSMNLGQDQIDTNLYCRFKILKLPSILKYKGLDRYLHFWIEWHKTIDKFHDFIYRIEDINKNPKKIFEDLNVKLHPKTKLWNDTKTNTWNTVDKYLTRDDLAHCILKQEFLEMSYNYGYKI